MSGKTSQPPDDVLIPGEVVDLCAPSDAPEVLAQWYRWFNDPKVTRYLAQGAYPNTIQAQRQYFESVSTSRDRIVMLIRPKRGDTLVGVASLSAIDHVQRQCDIAIVIGEQAESADALFYALETKSRLTEHAFDTLGVERINSSQVVDLIRWQRWQILFGYQIEGVQRKKFRKGHRAHDVLISSCLLEDYRRLKELREGELWPGKRALFEQMKTLPTPSLLDELRQWIADGQARYWAQTFGGGGRTA